MSRKTFEQKLTDWKIDNPIERGTLVEFWIRGEETARTGRVRAVRRVDGHMQYYVKHRWRGHVFQVPDRRQIRERIAELYPERGSK